MFSSRLKLLIHSTFVPVVGARLYSTSVTNEIRPLIQVIHHTKRSEVVKNLDESLNESQKVVNNREEVVKCDGENTNEVVKLRDRAVKQSNGSFNEHAGVVKLRDRAVKQSNESLEHAGVVKQHDRVVNLEGVVELCLNRPEAKNALSKALVGELWTRLEEIGRDDRVRCVLLRSLVKGVFCAGADLKERLTLTESQTRTFVSTLQALTSLIEAIPVPVIAVLDGGAYGGGLEMALACDLRVAADNALMGLVETKLAIIPGAGGTQRLPRVVGVPLAKELIYTGRLVDATEAKSIHLINHLVPQNSNHDAAYLKSLSLAEQISQNGPVALRMAKLAIGKGSQMDLSSGLAFETACYQRVVSTQDRVEGLKSFIGKYKPVYKGE